MSRYALKSYWFSPRKPYLEVDGSSLRLFLPPYFGPRTWTLEAREVGVCDGDALAEPVPTKARPIAGGASVPYLFTTGPYTAATTMLLFRSPQRVPALRLAPAVAPNTDVPIGYFESRSKRGADLDGVLLRFEDPSAVAGAMEAAGVERVRDPNGWLASHRRLLAPGEARESVANGRRAMWVARSQLGTCRVRRFSQ